MGGIPLNRKKCYLFFKGQYMVSAASDALCRYDIKNRIVRAPVYLQNSCGFAVLIDEDDEIRSCELLEKEKIHVNRKVFISQK